MQRRTSTPHSLPAKLAITITSYPPRYPTLASTIRSLLAQSVRPDHVYLWIAKSDLASLPSEIRQLEACGLEIMPCEDLRSYKKIIPALVSNPNRFLVTADDDLYYPRQWLSELVNAYQGDRREVICGRAHRIRLDRSGAPVPYIEWETEVLAGPAERLIFPTGVGGVLYAPGIFHSDVTRADIFEQLCPTADDVRLYWMAALGGARFRKVGPRRRQITWPDSQQVGLVSINLTANDKQIASMSSHYGFPWEVVPENQLSDETASHESGFVREAGLDREPH